jgi:beta-lactamase regulating signal transducer with metallopeptidase domain
LSVLVEQISAAWSDWMFGMSGHLVCALAVVSWCLQRRSAVFLHALWLLVLVRLVLPPGLALPTGWASWSETPTTYLAGQFDSVMTPDGSAPDAAHKPNATPSAERASSSETTTTGPARPADPTALGAEHSTTSAPVVPLANGANSTAASESFSWTRAWGWLRANARPWLMFAWAGVSATLFVLLIIGAMRTAAWVRKATRIEDPRLLYLIDRWKKRLGMSRPIELKNSYDCTTPLVVGFLKPVILLPESSLRKLDEDELEAVLVHEMHHVARHDALINVLQGALSAIYFFHPLVWWANAEIRRHREHAVDEMTIAALQGRRKAYGSALVKIAESFGYGAPPLTMGVMETKHPAKHRLARILDPACHSADRWPGPRSSQSSSSPPSCCPPDDLRLRSRKRRQPSPASRRGIGAPPVQVFPVRMEPNPVATRPLRRCSSTAGDREPSWRSIWRSPRKPKITSRRIAQLQPTSSRRSTASKRDSNSTGCCSVTALPSRRGHWIR